MIEHEDGSVSVFGLRFMPLMMRVSHELVRVPEMFALPGGGRARLGELPDIASRLRGLIDGEPTWT